MAIRLDDEDEDQWVRPPAGPTVPHECGDCGGNCDPECGHHPWGCLFSGIVYGEWAIDSRCKLEHYDVARAIARRNLDFLDLGVRVWRTNLAR